MNRKIKILFNAKADKDSYNAQDLNAREIAIHLDSRKYQSYLFLEKGIENADKRLLDKKNVHLIKLPNIKFLRGFIIITNFFSNKFDIIISGRVFRRFLFYLKFRKFYFDNKKVIFTIEILSKIPLKFNKIYWKTKYAVENSDYPCAISKMILKQSNKLFNKKVNLLYSIGINNNIFYSNKIANNEKKLVISCGSLSRRKQPDLFLKIAERNPNYDFILIGDGELRSKILNYKKINNVNNFRLMGSMDQTRVANWFRKADIFLFPSIREGFPKVVLEAMGCGLPAIVFNHYGPEAVINNKTGYIVKNITEMENKMHYLLKNQKILIEMSKAAARRAKNFTWNKISKNYESVINEII